MGTACSSCRVWLPYQYQKVYWLKFVGGKILKYLKPALVTKNV
jgi:hypothetical protein